MCTGQQWAMVPGHILNQTKVDLSSVADSKGRGVEKPPPQWPQKLFKISQSLVIDQFSIHKLYSMVSLVWHRVKATYKFGFCHWRPCSDSSHVTAPSILSFYYYFLTRGKPLVAQKLEKKIAKFVWKWTLLWPKDTSIFALAGRHQRNHHAAKPN